VGVWVGGFQIQEYLGYPLIDKVKPPANLSSASTETQTRTQRSLDERSGDSPEDLEGGRRPLGRRGDLEDPYHALRIPRHGPYIAKGKP
jgi:hypothetical protein